MTEEYDRSPSADRLDRIISFTRGDDYWYRFYAINFLGTIVDAHPSIEVQSQIVGAISPSLNDDDTVMVEAAANSLSRASGVALQPIVPQLSSCIHSSKSYLSTLYAIQALGKMRNFSESEGVVKTLRAALLFSINHGKRYEAERIEGAVAKALGNLGQISKVAVPDLESVLDRHDDFFAVRVAGAILNIDPANTAARNKLLALSKTGSKRVQEWALEVISKHAHEEKMSGAGT